MSVWDQVADGEVIELQKRADANSGSISLDDALSALQREMTNEVLDDTRDFWERRGVKV